MNTQQIVDVFKSKGIKLTPQRIAVYKYLAENHTHPDALTVYNNIIKTNPSFSKTTVYNCLQTLTECGLLIPVNIDKDKIHYDADTSFHGHFRCINCGEIYDFKCTEGGVCGIDGFEIRHKDVYYSGICSRCKK